MAYRNRRSVLTLHKQAARKRTWPKPKLTMAQKLAAALNR